MGRVSALIAAALAVVLGLWFLTDHGHERAPRQAETADKAETAAIAARTQRARPADTVIDGTVSSVATVWLVGAYGSVEQESAGAFEMAGLQPGTYCLVASGAAGSASRCGIQLARGERRTVALTLVPVASHLTVRGVVRDGGGGDIAGARVIARQQPLGETLYAATTSAQGGYALALPRGDYALEVDADGYAPLSRFVSLLADSEQSFSLIPAATITGIVVDAQHHPVAGAEVRSRLDEYYDRGRLQAVTLADGRFELRDLPAGTFHVTARGPDGVALGEARGSIELGGTAEVELVLHAGVTVRGEVRWRGGGGVAGASVETLGAFSGQTVVADGGGRFRIDGVAVGELPLEPSLAGKKGEMKFVLVPPSGRDDIVLELSPTGTLSGRVLAQRDRAPVVDAEVRVGTHATLHTDVTGQFTTELDPGSVHVTALHPAIGIATPVVVDVAPGAKRDVELLIGAGDAAIEGTVHAPGGRIVANTKVQLTSSGSLQSWSTVTGAAGEFRFAPLPAGTYVVEAESRGASGRFSADDARASVQLPPGETTRVKLAALVGDRTLAGRVVRVTGQPVVGAQVWAERLAERGAMQAGPHDATAYTLADGTFELFGIPDGEYTVGAYHVVHERARAGRFRAGARDVVVTFAGSGSIAGTVTTADGAPLPVFTLDVSFPDGTYFMSSWRRVFTNGRFELPNIPPRTYQLTATGPRGESGEVALIEVVNGKSRADIAIVCALPGGIRGRLVDKASKQPVAGVDVAGKGSRTRTGMDGRFTLESVAAGTNQPLWVHARDGSSRLDNTRFDLTIEAGKVTDIGDFEVSVD